MDVAKEYTIAYRGLKNGLHSFDFPIGEALFASRGNDDILAASCHAHVDMERAERTLSLHTTVDGTVTVPCDRCLEPCDVPVRFEGDLLVRLSDEAGEYDGDVMWVSPSEDEVDLAQYLYESVVLSLPYQRVHADGGCDPAMLARFSIVSDAEFAAMEARAEVGDPAASRRDGEWGKLEALRERMARETADEARGGAVAPEHAEGKENQ